MDAQLYWYSDQTWRIIYFCILSHQLCRSCSLWYQVFYTSPHISWRPNRSYSYYLSWADLVFWDKIVKPNKRHRVIEHKVQCYLGNSLWVGKATILWSFRACSYNSFSEWEWSCEDLPVITESDAAWKLILFILLRASEGCSHHRVDTGKHTNSHS